METNNVYSDIIQKRNYLQNVAKTLKQDFIGLDEIIDEIISLLSSWYLFPQAQLRPLIINMWGMTGSGKTALVQRLVELLDYKKLYAQMDMGEFESDSASWMKAMFTDELEFFHEKPNIICFDEFQFARTLNNDGAEIGKDKLRVIWEMIDSGKIGYVSSNGTYYLKRADMALMNIFRCLERGVEISGGNVTKGEDSFLEIFKNFFFESEERHGESISKNYFNSRDFLDGLYYLYVDDNITREVIRDQVKNTDLEGLIGIIERGIRTRTALKILDLSKSVIFILGNLDEAYHMSHSVNPDINADELHAVTLKINITHIKSALGKRFRPEQIARLGNNHIIYRSFKSVHFRELIYRELQRIGRYMETQFGFSLHFHAPVYDMLYKEGVFPAQGTRPVLTTIKNYIEAWTGKLVVSVLESGLPITRVEWSCMNDCYYFSLLDANGAILKTFEEKVCFKLGNLRKKANPDVQAHTAVHEAGHAVLAVLTLRIIPSLVVSKSMESESDGFCMVNMPEGILTRDVLKKDIMISLGGYLAEKMIFGEQNTSSGVEQDIERASEMANLAIKKFAMGSDPVSIAVYAQGNNEFFYTEDKYKQEAMNLIRECEDEAEKLLLQHKRLLLAIAEFLSRNYKLEENRLEELVIRYCDEEWIRTEGFRRKENYFSFQEELRKQFIASNCLERVA